MNTQNPGKGFVRSFLTMLLGVFLTFVGIGIYQTVVRWDALVMAWQHPDEVKSIEVQVSRKVVQK